MDVILDFFKNRLEAYLQRRFGPGLSGVGYLNSTDWDPLSFPDGQITLLVVNIEEDRIMRPDHLYQAKNANGNAIKVKPQLRLNFYLLFVAKFTDNKEAWKQLYEVISYFQTNNIFQKSDSPDLPPDTLQLVMELVSMSFSEQNEIWSSLKAAYHPSVLYRMKLNIIQREDANTALQIKETAPQVSDS